MKNLYTKKLALLLFISLTLLTLVSNAKNYYIAANGSDANTGLSAAAAWKTVAKVNTSFSTFLAGDSILFKSGDTFYGNLVIAKSGTASKPIVISAYGSGTKPVITGFTTISGWTNEGAGIYSKVITSAALTNMVTIDDRQYAMGRYPDAAYLSYETFSTTTSVTDNTLGTATNWAGAEAVIRKNDWTIDRTQITNHTANTLTYTSLGSTSAPINNNFGYFIQNDLRTLTIYGEWYHNITTGKFYMYFGAVDPNTKTVKFASTNYVISNAGFDYVTIDNINLTGSIDDAVHFTSTTDYCNIQNCDISFAGKNGVSIVNGSGDLINADNVSKINGLGIVCDGTNTSITNNTVLDIGLIAGQVLGSGGCNGIYSPGNNVVIRNNTVRRIGATGIVLKYSGAGTIQYNLVDSACMTFDDGGGIYTSGPDASARLIDHNIILNTVGNNDGTPDNVPISAGIYLDEQATNVTVSNNSIANINYAAIKFHKAHEDALTDNSFFNNKYGIGFFNDGGSFIRNISLKGNISVAKTATQQTLRHQSSANDVALFGTADNNYYLRPVDDNLSMSISQPSTGNVTKSLSSWQAFTNQDALSKKSPRTVTDVNDLRFEYNASGTARVVSLGAVSYLDAKGAGYTGSVTIPAWGSLILIANGAAPVPNQLPLANAGSDKIITLPTNSATLTGGGTDADGTISSYAWTKISGPSSGTIATAGAATTAVNNLTQGTYQYQLLVTDNKGATAKDTIQLTVNPAPNQAPTANAGTDNTIILPTNSITLTGTATDADGTITITWTKISGPSSGAIVIANAAATVVNNLTQGVYQFELTVTDNDGATKKDTVMITVNPAPNQAPVANAGMDITIALPTNSVTLTGTAIDVDGTVAVTWTKISGPSSATIVAANTVTTTVNNLTQGVFQFELAVTDNNGATTKDTVVITVNAAPNQAPVANAGTDNTITLPTNTFTLTGTATDTDGTISNYAWTKISGPLSGTIETANAASAVLNDLSAGVYQYELTVTDNNGAISKDTVIITVNPALNQAPIADAGTDIVITLPTNFTSLTGTGTDTDGSVSSYSWAKISGPISGAIETPNTSTTTLSDLSEGFYQYELTVTDNDGAIAKDIVQITVNGATNQAPIADAGPDLMITLPTNFINLTGAGTDADGTISSYLWAKISGPFSGTIETANAANTLLTNLSAGIYQYELTITDNSGAIAKDIVQVTVNAAPNELPVANAGADNEITLPANSTVLTGSGADPDGTIASYIWLKISGPASGTIESPSAATTVLNNLSAGIYQFELTVTDNDGAIAKDIVQLTVNAAPNEMPVANAGPDKTITLPTSSVSLAGTGSDPNGTITGYKWVEISGPLSGTIAAGNTSTATANNLTEGAYQFELTVTDNDGAVAKDTIEVTVNAAAVINLRPAINPTNIVNGLNYKYYIGNWEVLPDFTKLTPAKTGITPNFNLSPTKQLEGYGFSFSGFIEIPADGVYTFYTSSDDGSKLYIDNVLTVDNDGVHPALEKSGTIGLKAGKHDITGLYFQGIGGYNFLVSYEAARLSKQTIPATALYKINIAPTASAGADQSITLPANAITFIGSGNDIDGTVSSYTWVKISGPSSGTIATANDEITSVTNLVPGIYQYELTVKDNSGAQGKDTVTVTVNPAPYANPVANAGADKVIILPANTTALAGSAIVTGSTISSYSWAKISGPVSGAIVSPKGAGTLLSGLVHGVYRYELTVKDNTGRIGKDTVSVIVNTAPVAKAGIDKIITLPINKIILSGTGTDADGTISSYKWTKIYGPLSGLISAENSAVTNVTNLDRGIYKFELTIKDNNGTISKDTMLVTVYASPVAKAGPDKMITLPANSVTLSGTASVAGGTITSYSWSRIGGSSGTIVTPNAATTSITNLVARGLYKFQLIAKDNNGAMAKDTVQITVNAAPVAKAGADQLVTMPISTTTLNGTGSDVGGKIISYSWVRISGSAGTIVTPAAATTSVTNLVARGVYKFELTVKDNDGAIAKDTMQIIVNQAPVAKAGLNQIITLPTSKATLSGTGTDIGGAISSYSWVRIGGPAATIANSTAPTTIISGLAIGVYKLELTVKDNNGATGKDTVEITVNQRPVAKAGADQMIMLPKTTATLSGTGTDLGGSVSSYNWVKISGPANGAIANANRATATLTGLAIGVYKYELTVKDNNNATGKDTVMVTVNASPVAKAGVDQLITLPKNTATLSGAVTDAGGSVSSYNWVKIAGPVSGTITNANTATAKVTNLVLGLYRFQLTVKDSYGALGKDTIQVIVNQAPVAKAGTDRSITLPVNTTTLTGAGTDVGGTISNYSWARVAGPSGTIVTANAATTKVKDLSRGIYKFELMVKDNNGAVGRDTVTVTVNAAPVVTAGANQLITLPINKLTLSGTASVAGATISSYSWTKISGPLSGTIASANAATATVTNLTAGIYKYQLSVTGSNGTMAKDTVQIIVNQPPVANAGIDKSIILPLNAVTLTGTGTDAGGTISSYSWIKIGSSPATIATANAATTKITGMTRGVYKFELTVKDNYGAIGKDTVLITVNAVPVVKAGVDRLITLPTNKLTLSGTASIEGATIRSYSWRKVAGPSSGTIAAANAATTALTDLVFGIYQYELSVAGSNGTVGKDTLKIIVNQAPVAKAGADKKITLPTNTVTLTGTGTDLGGTVSSYTWTKISGPAATIANAGAATTAVSNLLRGIYKFELTVTDNNGAFGKDTVEITVNQAPVANAGVDKTITLPVNTVTLTGTGTDAGGTISSYSWVKLGSSPGTIAATNAGTTAVTGLTRGVYKFELTVKDNNGAVDKDTVIITVNAALSREQVKDVDTTSKKYEMNLVNTTDTIVKDTIQVKVNAPVVSKPMPVAEIRNEMKVYPNPVRDIANVDITTSLKGKAIISVTDMGGKTIKYNELANLNKNNIFKLDMSNLRDGYYIVTVRFEDGHQLSSKVVKYGGK